VHALNKRDFLEVDRRAARVLAGAACAAGVARIVYLGGITPNTEQLSDHLASRAEVGQILLDSGVPTIVLQAAAILGSGSASFEMLRYLTERLPAMITPRWVHNRIQPIAVGDVLHYLTHAAAIPSRCGGMAHNITAATESRNPWGVPGHLAAGINVAETANTTPAVSGGEK